MNRLSTCSRLAVPVVCFLILAVTGRAEFQRTLQVLENKMPELHKAEVGGLVDYTEYADKYGSGSAMRETVYGRFGLLPNLTVFGAVPYMETDPKGSTGQNGFADLRLGAALLAYEDIFRYPYVIPHVEVSFPTGDQDKGTGAGEVMANFGVSCGTTVEDVYHFVVDGGVQVGAKDENRDDHIASLGGALIWDLSDQFSVLGEARVTSEDTKGDGTPWYVEGGMVYKGTDSFQIGAYVGHWENNPEDMIATAKIAYKFE